ncbi:MAG: homoserine dehydrogenase [Clostridiales bacterium]|nr:homoserine dehydrogenase [Clostridiales bacterium]
MKEIIIGFLGCGNVGSGVWKLLKSIEKDIAHRMHLSIRVKKVLVRDVNKARNCDVPHELLTASVDELLDDPEITLVVECMGGEQPATEYMLRALRGGKTVVTANKVALALNWHRLQAAAQERNVGLYYEASVCGAIPVINVLQNSLQANRIGHIMGIINGTTNYILSRMYENGEDYRDVLGDAQRLGLAEPNPASDVEGYDAAYKLSIMASLAFHGRVPVSKVYTEGITKLTAMDISCGKEMGYVLKLLAIAKREENTVQVRVHPTFLPESHPLSSVNGSFNAMYLHGHACQEMMLQGRGAGDLPTASAVVSDILHAATVPEHSYPTFANTAEADPSLVFNDNWVSKYFIRLSAEDRPGVLAKIAGWLAQEDVSIATMLQKGRADDGRVPLIFVTHTAPEKSLRKALESFDTALCTVESVIRVEE